MQQVVAWNHLTNPDRIFPGERLIVGFGVIHTPVHYVVVSGDNLTAIANRFHVSVAQLLGWNHIADPNRIYPGEVLVVGYR